VEQRARLRIESLATSLARAATSPARTFDACESGAVRGGGGWHCRPQKTGSSRQRREITAARQLGELRTPLALVNSSACTPARSIGASGSGRMASSGSSVTSIPPLGQCRRQRRRVFFRSGDERAQGHAVATWKNAGSAVASAAGRRRARA